MRLADTLKNLRILKNMTQKELAKVLDVSRNCVSNWECNLRKPSLDDLARISKFFDYPLMDLIQLLLTEQTIQDVKDINQDKEKGKTKISFVVPVFNLIMTVIVCIALVTTFIITKNINQYSKYENGIIYEDEIEKITLIVRNNRNQNNIDLAFNSIDGRHECNNISLSNVLNSYINKDDKIYINPVIKYYNYSKSISYPTKVCENKNNLLVVSNGKQLYVPYQNINYNFVLHIYDNCCYVGAYEAKEGEK